MNILFWNTGGREPLDEIAQLVRDLQIDILILAECPLAPVKIVAKLNPGERAHYHLPLNLSGRLTFVAALPPARFKPVYDSSGVSVRHIDSLVGQDALLVALHLPSKLFLSEQEQALLAPRTVRIIEDLERQIGHRRTVVIGDFNMNPFEAGMVSSEGLHATMARSIAAKESRTVLGQSRHYFYNPMWSLMGDYSPGPPGTYYYLSSSPLTLFWNTFDQVLLRPDLARPFQPGDVRIIDSVGSRSLLSSAGVPNTATSDHLPLFATVRLEESNHVNEESLGRELPAIEGVRTPTEVLKEQATVLADMTHGVLEGEVSVVSSYGEFKLKLDIVAPSLDNYRYRVAEATHDVLLYPVEVVSGWDSYNSKIKVSCANEGEFENALGEILSSEKVRQVLTTLLAQSKAI